MKDKNGIEIIQGATVDVPEPSGNDMHSNEFRGYVEVADNNGTVIVLDGDGDAWEFEPERLIVIDEDAEAKENDAAIEKYLSKK